MWLACSLLYPIFLTHYCYVLDLRGILVLLWCCGENLEEKWDIWGATFWNFVPAPHRLCHHRLSLTFHDWVILEIEKYHTSHLTPVCAATKFPDHQRRKILLFYTNLKNWFHVNRLSIVWEVLKPSNIKNTRKLKTQMGQRSETLLRVSLPNVRCVFSNFQKIISLTQIISPIF